MFVNICVCVCVDGILFVQKPQLTHAKKKSVSIDNRTLKKGVKMVKWKILSKKKNERSMAQHGASLCLDRTLDFVTSHNVKFTFQKKKERKK